jgi:dihydrofolate reductase
MQRQKVLWHITMSVDGFIAGPDDDMEALIGSVPPSPRDASFGPMADEVMASIGAVLGGRRWHDLAMARYEGRRGIYGGTWEGPVLVLTHEPPDDPPDSEITFVTGTIEDAVRAALAAAAPKNLVVFGADIARQCVSAGLLDEIAIHVAPVLLGAGVPLFRDGDGAAPVRLERIDADAATQVTDLRYRVVRG